MRHVAGLVLTGGASERFGADKATLLVGGERLADRTMRVLGTVADPVLEVGPAFTSSDAVREDPPGGGPLAAVAAGGDALRRAHASDRPVLVVAVDLPFLDAATLCWLADHPATTDAVVPVVDGHPQSLCARYGPNALLRARELVQHGERSMHALLAAVTVHHADEEEWRAVSDPRAFADVDTRDDAAAFGVEMPR